MDEWDKRIYKIETGCGCLFSLIPAKPHCNLPAKKNLFARNFHKSGCADKPFLVEMRGLAAASIALARFG